MSDVKTVYRPSLSVGAILIRYVLFAVTAGLANIATQEIVVRGLRSASIIASILAGTAMGFLVKYLLDKRWVFLDGYQGHAAEVRKIAAYGAFGVGTTLLFWAIELSFWHVWRTVEAKYIGAVIGLALGNWVKYQLDKHYVFPRRPR